MVIEDGLVFIKPAGSEGFTEVIEPYLNAKNAGKTYKAPPSSGDTSRLEYTVPKGYYFLMGDNRQGSLDSRSFRDDQGDPIPYVEEDDILGRVWLIALPISKIHALEPPIYDF